MWPIWPGEIANCCKPSPSRRPPCWRMRACCRKSEPNTRWKRSCGWRGPSNKACFREACRARDGCGPAAVVWLRTRWAATITMTRVSSHCWSAVVADVSGKGVSSALLASLLQGALITATEHADAMGHRMERLNRFLLDRTGGEKYATVFYCLLH